MLDRDTDYMPIFELAEQFAMSYSAEILVNRSHKEEIRRYRGIRQYGII